MRYLDEIEEDLGPEVIKKVCTNLFLVCTCCLKLYLISPLSFLQLTVIVQRQRFLELMSWQSGGEQRMAFPPWKPLSDLDKAVEPGADQKLEMGVVLQHLNALKSMCTTAVRNSSCNFCLLGSF